MVVKRGDIYYADLRPVVGSEQGGVRPVLIIQNDMGNRYSPTVICAAITSKMNKAKLPTHIALNSEEYGIVKDSVILLEQVRTIDKSRLREKVCHLDESVMRRINQGLEVSPGTAYIRKNDQISGTCGQEKEQTKNTSGRRCFLWYHMVPKRIIGWE